MSNLKGLLLSAVLLITLASCSSTQKTTSTDSSSGIYPSWYSASGFSSDSTAYHGFGSAVSSDSVIAIANAELSARAKLETVLAERMEEVRLELEETNNDLATNPDFILTLRNAHQKVQDEASESNGVAVRKDGYYMGYASVRLNKSEFRSLMESGFRGNSSYWQAISDSEYLK